MDKQLKEFDGGMMVDEDTLQKLSTLVQKQSRDKFRQEVMGEAKTEDMDKIEKECHKRVEALRARLLHSQREKVSRKAEEQVRALTDKVDTGDYQDRESLEEDVAKVRESL